MSHPIPNAALDDRLGFVGTAGAGKTYNAMAAVERILARRGRVLIPDPLGVWWGLRLAADGRTPSRFDVVIFGGPHGDLPIGEHAGALIGETAARMAESAIVDLSAFGTKAAERRFMLAFLAALHRNASGEPVHLIFDEADLWAPQRLLDKEGEAAKLQGQMEHIVRRGRIKGFIPWLITQRPAVLSKDVLSQVDGLIAFKLTSSQDRDAIGAWIEGQADRAEGKRILGSLPAMQRGQGVVWVPGRAILETCEFPEKTTFDSSRTPKRGERQVVAELKPLDLPALKERMAKVETETRANDPAARIAELERELRGKGPGIDNDQVVTLVRDARNEGYAEGHARGRAEIADKLSQSIHEARKQLEVANEFLIKPALGGAPAPAPRPSATIPPLGPEWQRPRTIAHHNAPSRTKVRQDEPSPEGISGAGQRILDALAELEALGVSPAPRVQVAFLANYSHLRSKGFTNGIGALRTAGMIDYPAPEQVALTDAGRAAANPTARPMTSGELQDRVIRLLGGPFERVLRPLIEVYPQSIAREEVMRLAGYGHERSKGFTNTLGRLRTLGFVAYPERHTVAATPALFV